MNAVNTADQENILDLLTVLAGYPLDGIEGEQEQAQGNFLCGRLAESTIEVRIQDMLGMAAGQRIRFGRMVAVIQFAPCRVFTGDEFEPGLADPNDIAVDEHGIAVELALVEIGAVGGTDIAQVVGDAVMDDLEMAPGEVAIGEGVFVFWQPAQVITSWHREMTIPCSAPEMTCKAPGLFAMSSVGRGFGLERCVSVPGSIAVITFSLCLCNPTSDALVENSKVSARHRPWFEKWV